MFSSTIHRLGRLLEELATDEGQAMAEYAILVVVVAIVVMAAAVFLGNSISSVFSSLSGAL